MTINDNSLNIKEFTMPSPHLASIRSYGLFSIQQHLQGLRAQLTSLNFWIVLSLDSLCILFAYLLAYYLRFEAFQLHERQFYYAGTLSLLFAVKLPVFYVMGLYNGMWRYTSLRDMQNLVKAVLLASLIMVSIITYINRFQGVSRAVFVMDAIICLLLLGLSRVSFRYALQGKPMANMTQPVRKKRLLMIGAGDAAERAIREIRENPRLPYQIVGLVDDNPSKIGLRIHGIPVLGNCDALNVFIDQTKTEELLIAIASITGLQMKRLVNLCQATGLIFKVIPGLGELIDGKVSVKTIRDISYRDLLGREELVLEQDRIGDYLTGKTILITGAGGSIGSELCRQLLPFKPELIVLFDSSEENLYRIQMELQQDHKGVQTTSILGRIEDLQLLDFVFNKYHPNVVFHTAAYKHVPMVELNPWQAVCNNINGSRLLMEAAILFAVERFVLISTDKAVRPTNIMGASKRITEILMIAYSSQYWDGYLCPMWNLTQQRNHRLVQPNKQNCPSHETRFMGVRFGNVLGSSGSVVPLFKRQIERGGPVTVTHPEVSRYFMSSDEAAQLILQAGSMGEGGEIFILKMGKPVRIADMAGELIKLTGREPGADIEVHYIGLRPGEKLHEELITEGEAIVSTHHNKIMVLRGQKTFSCHELHNYLNDLDGKVRNFDITGIKKALKAIVPEYTPQ